MTPYTKDDLAYLADLRNKGVQHRFTHWILARELARETKDMVGGPGPWVDDPIISRYHFCNVNREHDRVTRWIGNAFRNTCKDRNEAVVQLLVCRIFNEPETLRHILPVRNVATALLQLKRLRENDQKIMRGVYMMPVHGNNGKGKLVEEYYLDAVREAMTVDWTKYHTLAQVAERLTQLLGIGDFLANQVCTDLRYTPAWKDVADWRSFVLCGPGTRRGINRYLGDKIDTHRPQKVFSQLIVAIRTQLIGWDDITSTVAEAFQDPNNLSNCFCEFDKYERVLNENARLKIHTPYAL